MGGGSITWPSLLLISMTIKDYINLMCMGTFVRSEQRQLYFFFGEEPKHAALFGVLELQSIHVFPDLSGLFITLNFYVMFASSIEHRHIKLLGNNLHDLQIVVDDWICWTKFTALATSKYLRCFFLLVTDDTSPPKASGSFLTFHYQEAGYLQSRY